MPGRDDALVEEFRRARQNAYASLAGDVERVLGRPTAARTEAKKTLVRTFMDDILVKGRMEKFAGYDDGDNYIQHDRTSSMESGLAAALKAMAEAGSP
jgi:hypothetical protein